MAESPRNPDGAPHSDRPVQLAASLIVLATVVLIGIVVLLTDLSRSVIAWTATAALLFLAVIFVQRR